jgi:hypothetical protein
MVFLNNKFVRRRWLDFRNGHSVYLVFLLTLVNFILIVYNFAILKIPALSTLNLPLFVLIFFLVYVQITIIIGCWHRRNQYAVENEALVQGN